MASLRGGDYLWNNAAVSNNGGGTDTSAAAPVGPGPYVALLIKNGGATALTCKVQATGAAVPSAGINNPPIDWYDYQKTPGTTLSTGAINAGATVCIELAPFSPELIRLVRTDSTGALTGVTAIVVAFGPN